MAYERKATVTYIGNGSQKIFAFPFDYLRMPFVKVQVNRVDLNYGIEYGVNGKQVELVSAPEPSATITIFRETSTTRLVGWENASVLTADDMSLEQVQQLHLAEETMDKVQDSALATDPLDSLWDARFNIIKNLLDPVNPGDAVTKRYFEAYKGKLSDAEASASTALVSQNAAKVSETNAKESETNAKESETNAKESETAAASSASSALISKDAAKVSETNAKASETNAKSYMEAANNYAGYTKGEADGRYAPKDNPVFTLVTTAGVKYPAIQNPSTDPNVNDDYEEGTFTPNVVGMTTAGVGTYTTQTGKYTKIGNTVTINLYIVLTAHTGTGTLAINGLPFVVSNAISSFGSVVARGLTYSNQLCAQIQANSSHILLQQFASELTTLAGVPMDTAITGIWISGTYFTN